MEHSPSRGSAALHEAGETPGTPAERRLERGAANSHLDMALLDAARKHDLQACRELIAAGADVNANDAQGDMPLLLAADGGSIELVKALVGAGARVDAVERIRKSALHFAAAAGIPEVIAYLCKQGADLRAIDMLDWTPLHFAAIYGRTEALELLLYLGAAKNFCAHEGKTALMMATRQGHRACIQILKEPVSLTSAAGHDHHHNVKMMLDDGIAIDSRENTKKGMTALNLASSRGHLDMVRMLLERGASAAATDHYGRRAIHCAASKGHVDIVEVLLHKGVSIDDLSPHDRSPLDHAASKGHVAMVKKLISLGAKVERAKRRAPSLILAARNGHLAMVDLLLDAGAPLDCTMGQGSTALHEAARTGRNRIAELLLARGASVEDPSHMYETPLQLAVEGRHHSVVRTLLKFKVDIEAPCQHGETALQLAVGARDLQMVQLLLAAGAKIDRVDTPRGSALLSAVDSGFGAAIDVMLQSKPWVRLPKAVLSRALMAAFTVDKLHVIGHFARAGVFYDKELLARPGTVLALQTIHGCNSLDGKFRLQDLAQGLTRTGSRPRRSDRAPSLRTLAMRTFFNTVLDRRVEEKDLLLSLTRWLAVEDDDRKDDLTYGLALRVRVHGGASTLRSPQLHLAPGEATCEFRTLLEKHARWDVYMRAHEQLDYLPASGNRGKTPLTLAILLGDNTLARLLVTAGASVYLPDANGDSPLHAAVKRASASMVRILMGFGACSGAEDREGQTALALAERLALHDIAQLLREPQGI